jgi:hypothetical protein
MPYNNSDAYLGGQLANTLLLSGAAGVGGMGLFKLMKHLKKQRAQEKAQQTDFQSLATTPPEFLAAKQAADISPALLATAGGGGLGALIGAIRAEKGKRLSGALGGGALGAGIGLAGHGLTSASGQKALGSIFASPDDSATRFKGFMTRGLYDLALVGGGAAAAAGGAHALNSMLDDSREEGNKDNVQTSRDEYFKTLLNQNDEKTAFSNALDKTYENLEKSAQPNWAERLKSLWEGTQDKVQGGLAVPVWLAGASALAGGGIGAKYMYDKTRAASQAKLYAAAQKARARMHGLDAPWVDPTELAQVKQLATQGGPSNTVGR